MEVYLSYNWDYGVINDGKELLMEELEINTQTYLPDNFNYDSDKIFGPEIYNRAMIGTSSFKYENLFESGKFFFSTNIFETWEHILKKISEINTPYYLSIVTSHVGGHSGYAPFIFRCNINENNEIVSRCYKSSGQALCPTGDFRKNNLSESLCEIGKVIEALNRGCPMWESSIIVIIKPKVSKITSQGALWLLV